MIFWNWWTVTILTYLGFGVASYFGAFTFLLENDPSYLSFVILGIFTIANLVVGTRSWRLKNDVSYYFRNNNALWFTSETLLGIGMIGTVLGFLIVLSASFSEIDTSSVESMQEIISNLATGMGTALLTTLTGLVSSTVLKVQITLLEETDV